MKFVWMLLLMIPVCSSAQESVPVTSQFSVEGDIKNGYVVTVSDLKSFPSNSIDSVRIYSHNMAYRKTLKKLKTVLLKDVLAKAEFNVAGPKWLSEFYITCIASDNYKVVFSWNELFNSDLGKKIAIVIEEDGKALDQSPDRIALVSPADHATGRRYVKGLSKIIIQRVK